MDSELLIVDELFLIRLVLALLVLKRDLHAAQVDVSPVVDGGFLVLDALDRECNGVDDVVVELFALGGEVFVELLFEVRLFGSDKVMLRYDEFLFVRAVVDLKLLFCFFNELLMLEQRLNKTLPVLTKSLQLEVVLRPRRLIRVRNCERKPVDIEPFPLVKLVFSMDEQVVFVLTVVHLN